MLIQRASVAPLARQAARTACVSPAAAALPRDARPCALTHSVKIRPLHDAAGDNVPRFDGLPPKRGLYDPSLEKDSCGVGFVVDIKGMRTHTTVTQALDALTHLDHRGAVAADGLTGDGVGLLTQVRTCADGVVLSVHVHRGALRSVQVPHLFFRKKLEAKGVHVRADTDIAVGMIFLPGRASGVTASATADMLKAIDEVFASSGLEPLLWRRVPLGEYVLGESARSTLPDIRQVVLRRPAHLANGTRDADDAFERLLYLTRKRLERRFAGLAPFYIPSLSSRTLVYKGLVVAPNLRHLYPDLNDSDFQSAIALFHQRYSTNTFPMWFTAQPFRMLAHNGEINTLTGNMNWMRMREETLRSPLFGDSFKELLPVIQPQGSDSAMLDNVFEMLVQCGRHPLHAMAMLVPEAYENSKVMDSKLRAFYDYQRTLMEPWDGPAALCFSDGRVVAAALDRNGLRPLRYWVTSAGKVVAGSEVGIVDVPVERVIERGKLGPGDMMAIDTERGVVLKNEQIKGELASRRPYQAWLERSINHVAAGRAGLGQIMSYNTLMKVLGPADAIAQAGEGAVPPKAAASVESRVRLKKAFGFSKEDEELVFKAMMDTAHEPIGSMGDDTPIAAFSAKPQLLYRYFKQKFAEVTNPPIDPLLERSVMSLNITFGRKGMLLQEDQHASFLIRLPSPVVTEAQLAWLLSHKEFPSRSVPCLWNPKDGPEGLEKAINALCASVEAAVDGGTSYMVLTDRGVDADHAPIPMLLAVGAVHQHLLRRNKRMRASILVETGEAREDHHIACLISYGASLVHPYLAFETVAELAAQRIREGDAPAGTSVEGALLAYRTALQDGLMRIMSKMGISTVDSYRGAQVMETLGLHDDVVEKCFAGTVNRLSCVNFQQLAKDVLAFHESAYGQPVEYKRGSALPRFGTYATVKGGEFHAYNPLVFNKLRVAAQASKYEVFKRFADEVDARPLCSLRDALDYARSSTPVPLAEVESVESIVKRFSTQAMSHGSISREAHEALAIAANRLGSRSNTGEGGEDPGRYTRYTEDRPELSLSEHWHPKSGDYANSRIKQVASARFGVTPTYLINAEQLEIKMAQGSKPGEGGHIPGHKVSAEIARNRFAQQGVTLISPPPHHDIYCIEDLAQLIYDLKRVNKDAQVIVKLVSEAGVGTISAGVAKAYADVIQISGHDGGTGASPLASIKNAGLPWELGLAEAQQVLVMNKLRERVTLRVDGGLKNGRDVLLAALLGAEQFGFGTAALVALGCVMARKCHLNTCPVGIATQDPELRKKFKGKPEDVVTFLIHTAEQVRRGLAEMGFRSLDEVIGRADLLRLKEGALFPKGAADMSGLLANPDASGKLPRKAKDTLSRVDPDDRARLAGAMSDGRDLDEIVWRTCRPLLDGLLAAGKQAAATTSAMDSDDEKQSPGVSLHFPIKNAARSVAARLSGEIARRTGPTGLPSDSFVLHFHGVAGQSFGFACNKGMKLVLRGEAHDYVGKSMYGGMIVLAPQSTPTHANGYAFADAAAVAAAEAPAPASALTSFTAFPVPQRRESIICGNTVLYGATGGKLFAAGRAGERCAVRNSGAVAVVEGTGDHACEYMTNGCVVVLGPTGRNFGAGMSGGEAFVLDINDTFLDNYNSGMIEAVKLEHDGPAERRLRALIEEHVKETGSLYGRHVLHHWSEARDYFWHVIPNTTPMKRDSQALVHVPSWSTRTRQTLATPQPTPATVPLLVRPAAATIGSVAGFSTTAASPHAGAEEATVA